MSYKYLFNYGNTTYITLDNNINLNELVNTAFEKRYGKIKKRYIKLHKHKYKKLCKGSKEISKINKERNRKGLPLLNENYQQETILKHYLKQIFPNHNIFWNRRFEKLGGLELDIYIPKYNLAVEYNGEQHYKFIPYFHKTRKDFKSQLERDKRKKELCKKWNINLIVVPYYIRDIENYINKKLRGLKNETNKNQN